MPRNDWIKKKLSIRRPTLEDNFEKTLGLACLLAGSTNFYNNLSFLQVTPWLTLAARHRQIAFAYDETEKPMAFVTWALLTPDVVWRFCHQGRSWIHESEWNEGCDIWIIDFVSLLGRSLTVTREFKGNYSHGTQYIS